MVRNVNKARIYWAEECVCVCVRACVCACACACVRACARACVCEVFLELYGKVGAVVRNCLLR